MSTTISGWNSSSISTLFSSLSKSSKSNSTDLSSITSNLSDYNLIRSGSYYKLMKAYYSDEDSDASSLVKSTTNNLKQTISSAASLNSSLEALESSSLYEGKSVTNEDGSTSTSYDYDSIYSALSDFVDSYNDLIDSSEDSDSSGVLSAVSSMTTYSKVNQKLLASVGISIKSDNTLKLDEDKVKSADISSLKSLFGTKGGYGYQVSAMSSMAKTYASNSLSTTYNSNGSYNYLTNSSYNSYI